MKTAIILTLGTRDINVVKSGFLKVRTEELWNRIEVPGKMAIKPRTGGEYLFKKRKQLSHLIQYPISKPAIEYCLEEDGFIDQVILVATDQSNEEVSASFLENDTVYFAELLKSILNSKYKDKLGENAIEIIKARKQVASLDSMVDFFNDSRNSKYLYKILDFDRIYLLNQGGIPSVNTALMLRCIDLFGDKLIILRVEEDDQECYPLNFTMQFLENSRKKSIKKYIESYNYASIIETTTNDEQRTLASYALYRLYFDFKKAINIVKKLNAKNRPIGKQLVKETQAITKNPITQLREVYANARIKFKQKAYVDFLLRLFRIIEEFPKIEMLKHIDFEFDHNKFGKDITTFLSKAENTELKEFLSYQTHGTDELDYTKPGIPTYLAFLRYFKPDEANKLKKLQSLSQLRNKSIAAHDFQPVSLERIKEVLSKNETSIEETFNILDELLNYNENPFDRINSILSKIQ